MTEERISPWAVALQVVAEHYLFPAALYELFRFTKPELRANGLPPDPETFGCYLISERAMESAINEYAPDFDRLHYDAPADVIDAYRAACKERGVVLGRGPISCSGLGEMWVVARYPDAAACTRAVDRLCAVQATDEGPAEERGYRVFAKEIGIDRVQSADIFGALLGVVSLGKQALLRHRTEVALPHVTSTGGEVTQVLRDLHLPFGEPPFDGDLAFSDHVLVYVRHTLNEGPHEDAVSRGDSLRTALSAVLATEALSSKVTARGDHGVEVMVVPRDAMKLLPEMAEIARGLAFDTEIELCRVPFEALPRF